MASRNDELLSLIKQNKFASTAIGCLEGEWENGFTMYFELNKFFH